MKRLINIKIVSILAAIFLLASVKPAFSESGDEIYDKLLKKYKDVNSVQLEFELLEDSKMNGLLKAKKGNKYILVSGNRTITCDGMTIWNYTSDDNKVVISDFDELDEGEVSLETFFFNFLKDFKLESIAKTTSSDEPPEYLVKLDLKEGMDSDLSDVEIMIGRDDFEIHSIRANYSGSVQTWKVKKVKLNKKFTDSDFEFKIPEGATVINLK